MSETQAVVLPSDQYPLTIRSVLVRLGQQVDSTTVLATYSCGSSEREECRAPGPGVVDSVFVKAGEVVEDSRMEHGQGLRINHDGRGVTVSKEEAARIEQEISARLVKEERLTLLVDLDQTIIHTAVEGTVGEWMNDTANPNYPALTDTYPVRLPESDMIHYVKFRPGTREFLAQMTKLYELHIYTMGTRNYAEAIARIIDPDKNLFGERIISRNDSGSGTIKSIRRLFPSDQSMVVVVDDRMDIWEDPSNIVPVKPYSFFVGIGDINAPFSAIPALDDISPSRNAAASSTAEEIDKEKLQSELLVEAENEQRHMVIDQQNKRPLLQQQLKEDQEATSTADTASGTQTGARRRRAVLKNDDNELEYTSTILIKIHSTFYDRKRRSQTADVRTILTPMKRQVFDGLGFIFSGVIPLGMDATRFRREAVEQYLLVPMLEDDDRSSNQPWQKREIKLGEDDWKEMDEEVDRVMEEDSDEDEVMNEGSERVTGSAKGTDTDDDQWEGFDEEFEEAFQEVAATSSSLKRFALVVVWISFEINDNPIFLPSFRKQRSGGGTPSPMPSRQPSPSPSSKRIKALQSPGPSTSYNHPDSDDDGNNEYFREMRRWEHGGEDERGFGSSDRGDMSENEGMLSHDE
ncbi:Carboxy-terminal domain (CTD) phosphatase [Borealophlyctis nickersoniae]|nr:Carboxy-terminal domain (CTD) phosphatase [Borealophlyctis nickersoniae]